MRSINWLNSGDIPSKSFVCGHCGHHVASHKGYEGSEGTTRVYSYICHQCYKPTYIHNDGTQVPAPPYGQSINHILDQNVDKLYVEARNCFSILAYTSSIMCCRKLLMNIAVTEGAQEGKNFVDYVDYLNDNNYIPPKGKSWVDKIRKLGNEANHKIEFRTVEDAKLILTFTEMLLRFIYEMPGLLGQTTPP